MTQQVNMNIVHRALWPGWQREIRKLKYIRLSRLTLPAVRRWTERREFNMRWKAGYRNQIIPF